MMASKAKDMGILSMDMYFPPNCVLQVDLYSSDGLLRGTDQNVTTVAAGMELGTNYMPHGLPAKPTFDEHGGDREIDGFWGYMLQIIYQIYLDVNLREARLNYATGFTVDDKTRFMFQMVWTC